MKPSAAAWAYKAPRRSREHSEHNVLPSGTTRFTTYVFQQRLGVLIDWSRVLRSSNRGERFKTWGMINDPDCCAPGSPNCPKTSLDETFGFDYCPGDDDLLAHVG